MSLNGKNKRKIKNTRLKVTVKHGNAGKYKVTYKGYGWDDELETYEYYKCYLKKPDGSKIYLCKADNIWFPTK